MTSGAMLLKTRKLGHAMMVRLTLAFVNLCPLSGGSHRPDSGLPFMRAFVTVLDMYRLKIDVGGEVPYVLAEVSRRRRQTTHAHPHK